MSLLKPERCVLLLSDEAVNIYDIASKKARFVQAIEWNARDFADTLIDTIVRHCKNKPVLILVDMVEQHYRKERIPNVSPLDKPNVIQRKLRADFPKFNMRAAKKLHKESSKQKHKSGDIYLFAALPSSKHFTKTIEAVVNSNAPIAGISLLPVESADLVASLQNKLGQNDPNIGNATWSVLITQNQGGGLRQIVTKNGELALTRVTPVVETDSEPDVWANEVAQEFKATMSYLLRFGFSPEDGLNVMVVANQKAGDLVRQFIAEDCSFTYMTVGQAAGHLGLKNDKHEDGRLADPLHAAWAGLKSRPSMPVHSEKLQKARRVHQAATAAMLILFMVMAYFVYSNANTTLMLYKNQQDYLAWREQKQKLDTMYEEELARKRTLGFDVKLIRNATSIHKVFEKEKVKPISLLKAIDGQLGGSLRIDSFELQSEESKKPRNQQKPSYKRDVTATMTISFPGTIDLERGNTVVENLSKRLDAMLEDYNVRITKKLADLSFRGAFSSETGITANRDRLERPYKAIVQFNRTDKENDDTGRSG
jgi:hypothetical protein